jgi:hypothetical protein
MRAVGSAALPLPIGGLCADLRYEPDATNLDSSLAAWNPCVLPHCPPGGIGIPTKVVIAETGSKCRTNWGSTWWNRVTESSSTRPQTEVICCSLPSSRKLHPVTRKIHRLRASPVEIYRRACLPWSGPRSEARSSALPSAPEEQCVSHRFVSQSHSSPHRP